MGSARPSRHATGRRDVSSGGSSATRKLSSGWHPLARVPSSRKVKPAAFKGFAWPSKPGAATEPSRKGNPHCSESRPLASSNGRLTGVDFSRRTVTLRLCSTTLDLWNRSPKLLKFTVAFLAPQSGFSSATRQIRPRISSVIFGRPPRRRDRQRQYSRKPARCQPTTVSGLTMMRTSDPRDQMSHRAVQNSRSTQFKGGRGRLGLRTATCCRRARTSSALSLRLR